MLRELVGDDDLVALVREKLGREPVEDLRIDLEDGYGNRSDDEEDADARRAATQLRFGRRLGRGGPLEQQALPVQGLRGADPQPRAADPRPVPRAARRGRPAPRGLRAHPPEGERGGAGRGPRAHDRTAGGRARADGQGDALRAADRDAAVDPRPRRHGADVPDGPARPPAAARVALRHLRLLRLLPDRGRAPEPGAPGRRPRQGGSAGGGGGHRRTPLRRLHQRAPGRWAGAGAGRVGQPPGTRAALPGARLLPGLGPAPHAAADPVRGHLRVPATASTPRPHGCAPTSPARTPASSTSPRRRGRWPTSCSAA